jgi:putative FmdB family regulatory protein
MPLYEYRCRKCRRRTTVLVRSLSQSSQPSCEHCGSQDTYRLISRFAIHRSPGSSLDDMDLDDSVMEDPRAMARAMRQMQSEMGEESTPEMEEMLDELESGKLPDESDFGDGEDLGDMDAPHDEEDTGNTPGGIP